MRKNISADLAIGTALWLCVCLPMASNIFSDGPSKVNEKRNLAAVPEIGFSTISEFPDAFELYYNDRFGLRDFFIYANNNIRYYLFGASGSNKVLIGDDGWLFYNGDKAGDGASVSNHIGLVPPGFSDRAKQYAHSLEWKRRYLSSKGIKYAYVVTPDKWTIYDEYLPRGYSNLSTRKLSDVLIDLFRANTGVEIIDTRGAVLSAKTDDHPLYYKKDTHWNNLGAYYAYYYIASSLSMYFPGITPRAVTDFTITRSLSEKPRDLANMLSIKEPTEVYYELSPNMPYSYEHLTKERGIREVHMYRRSESFLPRAIIFRDSFMSALIPYMSDHFSSATYIWSSWGAYMNIDDLLEKLSPDIVIEQKAERYLSNSFGDFI